MKSQNGKDFFKQRVKGKAFLADGTAKAKTLRGDKVFEMSEKMEDGRSAWVTVKNLRAT